MRIAQIAPLIERVPPPGYGGTELVVSLLTEGLVSRGHDVTLFATGDSLTSARLRSICPTSLRAMGMGGTWESPNIHIYHLLNAVSCLRDSAEFDIIHNHAGPETMITSSLTPAPILTTLHNPVHDHAARAWEVYRGYYNAISRAAYAQLPLLPEARYVGTIHHGIDYQTFPFSPQGQGYLLVLSRICPHKGVHIAIEVAQRLGRPLLIAGKIDAESRDYFARQIEPHLDGRRVRYLGEADGPTKRELYKGADGVLLPITWPEPFGLTAIEAMACGTPVICFPNGALPEIVVDGKTGFLPTHVDEMVAAVQRLGEIDRHDCRQHVQQHFSVERMVDDYLAVYHHILARPLTVPFYREPPPVAVDRPLVADDYVG